MGEYVSFRHIGNQSPTKAGIPLCRPSAYILPYGFSMPCKRQALISSLPSHLHQARFHRRPTICGLAFRYQVSAVCFAYLCGEVGYTVSLTLNLAWVLKHFIIVLFNT